MGGKTFDLSGTKCGGGCRFDSKGGTVLTLSLISLASISRCNRSSSGSISQTS